MEGAGGDDEGIRMWVREIDRIERGLAKEPPLYLTHQERVAVQMCLGGEVENDDGHSGGYMSTLRRVLRKMLALTRQPA